MSRDDAVPDQCDASLFCHMIIMDDYSVGTAVADDFDNTNKLVYSASGRALVRFANSPVTKTLSSDYDRGADCIDLVSFDKDKGILGARKALIAALFQDWNVPKVAIDHLFDPRPIQGFFDVSAESICCCWYHVPVEGLSNVKGGLEHSMLHVWQVLDVHTSHVRVLVLHPPFMEAGFIAVLPSFFTGIMDQYNLQWSQIHLILIRTALQTWQRTRWVTMSLGATTVCPLEPVLSENQIMTLLAPKLGFGYWKGS